MSRSGQRFPPSAKKLKTARKKGDVAKSRLLTSGILYGVFLIAVACVSGSFCAFLRFTESSLALSGIQGGVGLWGIHEDASACGLLIGWLLCGFLSVISVATIAAELIQTGCCFSPLEFKLARLSPADNLKRLIGVIGEGEFELAGSAFGQFLRTSLMLTIALICLAATLGLLVGKLVAFEPRLVEEFWAVMLHVGLRSVLPAVLVVVCGGVLDLLIARRRRIRRLEMDLEELRRELRESDGDPEQKGMQRQLYQELLEQSAIASVRRAQAVVYGERQ